MPLRFVLDEIQRGLLWRAVIRHNQAGVCPLDVVRVGDLPDLPLGSADPDILLWCEREDRILVSFDKATLAGHLANHLQTDTIHQASSCSIGPAVCLRLWHIWPWPPMPATPGSGKTASSSSRDNRSMVGDNQSKTGLRRTKASAASAAELQKALPRCQIECDGKRDK